MTTPQSKLRIAVLYGGRSPEHDVSVLSATNVAQALDQSKYEIIPVFVTREGQWLLAEFSNGTLSKPERATELCLISGGCGRAIAIPENAQPYEINKIDMIFPVLHGLHGEDGSIQGLAETARLPLIGCGILGSATALDKDIAKRLLNEALLPTAKSRILHYGFAPAFDDLKTALGLPVFIKPARQGSSVGVSKVTSEQDYNRALEAGFMHDTKLLAEEYIHGREIECAVLENPDGSLFVSRAGEIIPSQDHAFYSYDAKYIDEKGAVTEAPARLTADIENRIRDMAAQAFKALGCDSMARVDFFLTPDMRILVNEINTIPGFTNISMYAKVMAVSGIAYPDLIERLIAHAMVRASARH